MKKGERALNLKDTGDIVESTPERAHNVPTNLPENEIASKGGVHGRGEGRKR